MYIEKRKKYINRKNDPCNWWIDTRTCMYTFVIEIHTILSLYSSDFLLEWHYPTEIEKPSKNFSYAFLLWKVYF